MPAFKMNHLHVICEDLQTMIDFWTSGVGASFKSYRTFGNADGAVLALDGLQINLRVPKENEKETKKSRTGVIAVESLL